MSVKNDSKKDKGNQYLQKYLECVQPESTTVNRFGKV